MSEQSEAAKRAAARKAKILARGNSGLNKLAQTARGDEAQMLYGDGACWNQMLGKADGRHAIVAACHPVF